MCSKDPSSPNSQLAAAALKGEPQACYRLACLCLEGALPPHGLDLALPLLERAAARGHAGAKKKLLELKVTLRRIGVSQEDSSLFLQELMRRAGEDGAAGQRLSSLRPGGDTQTVRRLELTADRYRSAAENGDLQNITGNANSPQAEQLRRVLRDPEAAKKLLSTPAAQKLFEALGGQK